MCTVKALKWYINCIHLPFLSFCNLISYLGKYLGLSWHLQPWITNELWFKRRDRTCLTKKFFMKTNMQRNFYLFIKLRIKKCTWKTNIWTSPDISILDPLMNYGLKDVIGHAWPKNTSWKLICKEISFCLLHLELQNVPEKKYLGVPWHLQPRSTNELWFKRRGRTCLTKKFFMKTNM